MLNMLARANAVANGQTAAGIGGRELGVKGSGPKSPPERPYPSARARKRRRRNWDNVSYRCWQRCGCHIKGFHFVKATRADGKTSSGVFNPLSSVLPNRGNQLRGDARFSSNKASLSVNRACGLRLSQR